ncbi:MAG: hypothetical protein AMXMBFR33_01640 [Candidatus Xenobia bacterium]
MLDDWLDSIANRMRGPRIPARVRLVPRTVHTAEGERAYAQFNSIVRDQMLRAERRTILREQCELLSQIQGWYLDADIMQRVQRCRWINTRLYEIGLLLGEVPS